MNNHKFSTYLKLNNADINNLSLKPNEKSQLQLQPQLTLTPKANRSWFYANELATIYNMPQPTLTSELVVAVVSFGGGLYGSVSNTGVLTNGDVQNYWLSIGILPANIPKVVIKTIDGATNSPNVNDGGSTMENTIDVESIGACCPSSNLTIVLYIAPNSLAEFPILLNNILNISSYKPSIVSISWGAPEIYYSNSLLTTMDNLFATAVASGINITSASGDNGSNDGVGGSGSYCDFPSSSPNVISCGGTALTCPNLTYDNQTVETAWSSGGGAISNFFSKPSYQSSLTGTKRQTPDIAMNADPNTGVLYLINGSYYIIGGTSIVAPTLAGFLAAIKSTKFMNTISYNTSNSNCFHDVKTGSNGAFQSKTGYDNCSGLGSIVGNLLATAFNSVSPPPPPPPPPSIIHPSSVSFSLSSRIKVGTKITLTATVLPFNSANKSVRWSSYNSRIATINNNGYLQTKAKGTTRITLTTVDNNITSSINITVY